MNVVLASTDVSIYFAVRNTATGLLATGLLAADIGSAYYRRGIAASVQITPLTDLAAITTAHTDGGVKEDPEMPGIYRVDCPDAAFAAGATQVKVQLNMDAGYEAVPWMVDLVAANVAVNVMQIGSDTQSATDLKDFVDTAYDPTTNQVLGVTTVGTINTVGSGAIAAASFAAGVLPSNFALLGINPSGHLTRVVLVDTATALTEDISGLSVTSPFLVAKDHSWKFDRASQVTAPNLIKEVSGFDDILLEMDFSGVLSNNASISSITSVTVTDEANKTEPTVASSALSADRKKVHITTDGAAATANSTGYVYVVTIDTTDGQTFVRKGRLVVE